MANPYARELTFLDSQTRTRRDHMKYLTLMRSIALLHQHQRLRKTLLHRGQTVEYIEVTKDDIRIANQLTEEVLGRSLDELPPQTRRLLALVDEMVGEQCQQLKMERGDFRFSRREVRQRIGWGDTQLRVHLGRLEELEYLLVHRGGRGQSFVYELVFERRETSGKPVLAGPDRCGKTPELHLRRKERGAKRGVRGGNAAPKRGIAGGARGEESPALARRNGHLTRNLEKLTTREAGGNHVVRTVSGVR